MPTKTKSTVSARKISVAKPAKPVPTVAALAIAHSAKPTPVKPVPAKPADTSPAANLPRSLTRDAAGIVRDATNYAVEQNRDLAYLRFFGSVMRANGNRATLAQIAACGVQRADKPASKRYNPHYAGSAKATDIGAINRLRHAGYLTQSDNGNTLHATALAIGSSTYNAETPAKPV